MSKFYGTLDGHKTGNKSTRCGHTLYYGPVNELFTAYVAQLPESEDESEN